MIWSATLIGTFLVSMVSFVGIFLVSGRGKIFNRLLLCLLCFATGALLGNCFFHLIPETYGSISNVMLASGLIIGGFMFFLLIDLYLHKRAERSKNRRISTYGYLSLYSDAVHNFTDGVLIAVAFTTSFEAGLTVTFAILLHEIPQEFGDFGILIKAGFSRRKALIYNFLSGCTAILAAALTLCAGSVMQNFSTYIIPIAAGGFLYIATVNLMPEIFRNCTRKNFGIYLIFIILGLLIMSISSLHGNAAAR
ncbi:MAG: ZIP family metal transporter [Prevotellaceae bacterium]|jgi:zinc and cadmium transporter|nr:ZIP family metal transporter [Prevotellaceae bacterium]